MNLKKFIGLPYKYLGRDFDGVDCYGLLFLIYKHVLGIDLPEYSNFYTQDWYKTEDHIVDQFHTFMEKIDPPYKKFDGILLRHGTKTIVNHIATYLGENKMIHIYKGSTSRIDRFTGFWESKLYTGVRFKYNG